MRFQRDLGEFVLKTKPEIIVETGSGASSMYILKALDEIGSGKLYSIDPEPFCEYEISHPRYELIKEKSFHAMQELYNRTGAWDMFLHDSDHWIECQTFEYEMAIRLVKQGGHIFSDDYMWNMHGAWDRFINRYGLIQFIVGDIAGVVNTNRIIDDATDKQLWNDAKNYGKEWRLAHNEPPCWTCEDELTEYWKYPNVPY